MSGASPVVDVNSTSKAQVLTRELLDSIPTGRTAQSYGQLITGITMAAPDVGGSRSMSQAGAQVRGMAGKESVVTLDGIQLNGMCGEGATQAYSNAQAYEEMVFQTSGAGADFFLAPASNCDEVVGHVPAGLEVFSIETLDDAMTAVEAIAQGETGELPTCTAG